MTDAAQVIRKTARDQGVRQHIVEKDYALSYLLAAIATTGGLGESLVLKGGTALRKLYFPEYRFSEDLDYSTQVMGPLGQIDMRMGAAVRQLGRLLAERGPFQAALKPLILKQAHPGNQKAYLIHVQFPGQRQALCRLKVEITIDEPILTPMENRPILHGFGEALDARVSVYSLVEITAEKMRALLQSRARLQERGWGASRVCRDYYDLWNLLRFPGVRSAGLIHLIDRKCAVRGVSYQSPQDFVTRDLLEVAGSEWGQQLLPFVPKAPPAFEVLPQVQGLILSLWG